MFPYQELYFDNSEKKFSKKNISFIIIYLSSGLEQELYL